MVEELAEGLFCIQKPFALGGLEIGVRSTIVKLRNGGLWMHSPVALGSDDVAYIKAQGELSFVVAPNLFHHIFLGPTKALFPDASFYGAPGLAAKRDRFDFDGEILDQSQWQDELDFCLLEGMPRVNEVAFFHKASRTLIVTDLIFNLTHVTGLRGQLISRLFGTYNRPAVSRLFQLMIKDKELTRQSIEAILDWPFETIVMAHGEVLRHEAHAIFERLVAPFLRD